MLRPPHRLRLFHRRAPDTLRPSRILAESRPHPLGLLPFRFRHATVDASFPDRRAARPSRIAERPRQETLQQLLSGAQVVGRAVLRLRNAVQPPPGPLRLQVLSCPWRPSTTQCRSLQLVLRNSNARPAPPLHRGQRPHLHRLRPFRFRFRRAATLPQLLPWFPGAQAAHPR